MQEFRVVWQQCPHVSHPKRVSFVKSPDAADAEATVRDHIERKFGIEWFSIHEAKPVDRRPVGQVLGE